MEATKVLILLIIGFLILTRLLANFIIYVSMILSTQIHWYYVVGFLGMVFLFNVISIPLMEKRQITRRSDYKDYILSTHRLLILPKKK